MEEKKKRITIPQLLSLYLILCPIFDCVSFLFRSVTKTSWSPSTWLRPILPTFIFLYLFFKEKHKGKKLLIVFLYALYAGIHLWIFSYLQTKASYGNLLHELQYIVNYTFMIGNLMIYLEVFQKNSTKQLQVSVLLSITIYITSMYLAIITNTSSSTYIEGMGYKGWFESGNSISAILLLSLFIIFNLIKEKKYRYWGIAVIALVGIYLATLMGTRVGLYGIILVLFVYATLEILTAILHQVQLQKWSLIGSLCAIVIVVGVVFVVGSNTLERRKHLKEIEQEIVDETLQQSSHISGSLLEIKEKIENHTLEEGYLLEAQKQSILDLYQFANQHNLVNNDMRMQQLIYHTYLIKNQANPILLLTGNGYLTSYRELVLEMEIPAFLYNFGILGFILYFVPFSAIFLYGVYQAIRNPKKIEVEYGMKLAGCFCSYALAFLSGYTFFNSSTMMMIIVLHVLLLEQARKMKKEEITVKE